MDFDPLIPNFDIIHNSTIFILNMINLIFQLSKISGTPIQSYTLGSIAWNTRNQQKLNSDYVNRLGNRFHNKGVRKS